MLVAMTPETLKALPLFTGQIMSDEIAGQGRFLTLPGVGGKSAFEQGPLAI